MRLSTVLGLFVCLFVTATAMAQNPPPGGRGGFGAFQQDPYQTYLAALGDVNLRPDFTLTADQKAKVHAAREAVKAGETKWRTDHAADLKKITDDLAQARQDQDQDKMREVFTKRGELMQTMPKTDDALAQIKAALTADQAKAVEARIAERAEEQRLRGFGGFGGRRGGGAPGQ